jgi:hypothetical protein
MASFKSDTFADKFSLPLFPVIALITAMQSDPDSRFAFAAATSFIPPMDTRGMLEGINFRQVDSVARPCGANPTFLDDVLAMGPLCIE